MTYSKEQIDALRSAYISGACFAASRSNGLNMGEAKFSAAKLYPYPKKKQRRVVRDIAGVYWKVSETPDNEMGLYIVSSMNGKIFTPDLTAAAGRSPRWRSILTAITAERANIIVDLFNRPDEEVDV